MVSTNDLYNGMENVRSDFPIFKKRINGKRFAYLDSASTSQKPKQVINAIYDYYVNYNSNIHRGIYNIAEKSTSMYISSKEHIAKYINANSYNEIIYTRNTTESINLVALTLGNDYVNKDDHILITDLEHHSNIVPWQLLAKRKSAEIDYIKLDEFKEHLDVNSIKEQLEKDPKIVAISHASNVLGTVNDVKEITREAHKHGSIVIIDGAQAVPHMPVDVRDINCDFYAFSSHKMFGPSGIGVLYGKEELLENMGPLFGGGDMIHTVTHDTYSWNSLPWKFEAGTPNIEGAIGLNAAIGYIEQIGIQKIAEHNKALTTYLLERLSKMVDITVYGPKSADDRRIGVVSFDIKGLHPHDVAQVFDSEGIAIRAGHHCAMPLITESLNRSALSRISFNVYNTYGEIDRAIKAIKKAKKLFKVK